MTRIKLDTEELDWQPAHEVWPSYRIEGLDAGAPDGGSRTDGEDYRPGVFLKVLRRPSDGGGCWCALLRFSPPPGKAIRVKAIAASDEEVFILSDASGEARPGVFSCNPKGLRHGNTFAGDTIAYVHYHGDPDQILGIELIELSKAPSGS